MKIILRGNEIEMTLENGTEVRGTYYYKDNNIYLKSSKAFDLSVLLKNKKEIIKNI